MDSTLEIEQKSILVLIIFILKMTITKALKGKLELPVSFTPEGKEVSLLKFVKDKNQAYLSLSSLNPNQKARITAERLRRKPELKLAVLGVGEIDKERAIAEVEAQTPLGLSLIEADQYVIQKLIQELEHGRLKDMIE